jgi:hypothetical protein
MKVMKYKKWTKGNTSKTGKGRVMILMHNEIYILTKFHVDSELCSGQEKRKDGARIDGRSDKVTTICSTFGVDKIEWFCLYWRKGNIYFIYRIMLIMNKENWCLRSYIRFNVYDFNHTMVQTVTIYNIIYKYLFRNFNDLLTNEIKKISCEHIGLM